MEQLEANIYQYNEVDAELLSSQHDFQDGTITQQQYNSVVQAYEQLLKGLDEEIDQQKAKLAEEGYYWDSSIKKPAEGNFPRLVFYVLYEAFSEDFCFRRI